MNESMELFAMLAALIIVVGAGIASFYYNNYEIGFFLIAISIIPLTAAKDSEIERLKEAKK